MPEWVAYATLALNLLILPLLGVLWKISKDVVRLEVQTLHCARETEYLKSEVSGLRTQMALTASAAASAASSAAAAAAAILACPATVKR